MATNIEVRDTWGALLVRATDDAGFPVRYWFEKDENNLQLFAEVILYEDGERHYVPAEERDVPPTIEDHLTEQGYVVGR